MKENDNIVQLVVAALLSLAGIVLLFVGMLLAPQGVIHETVLVAFGEIATFAGSIMGIDYHYKQKMNNDHRNTDPPNT